MSLASRQRFGLASLVLVALSALAVVAAFVWGVTKGETAAVTAGSAVLVFAVGEYSRRWLAAQQYRWDKVAPQYEAFLQLIRDQREVSKDDMAAVREFEERSERVMGEFGDKLLLWGTPRVVKAWTSLARIEGPGEPKAMMETYASVLFAIRRELGHGPLDSTLSKYDLLGVILGPKGVEELRDADFER